MKILTVCNGGKVRSAALAEYFKSRGYEAIAASTAFLSRETLEMLCAWADKICPVEPRMPHSDMAHNAPKWENCVIWEERFAPKREIINLGPDIWSTPTHPDLTQKIARMLESWKPS